MKVSDPVLILASASPRRKELLSQLGIDCKVEPANIDESRLDAELPEQYVKRLALQKARCISQKLASPSQTATPTTRRSVVLGADTVVVFDGEVLGKPVNKSDALRMLSMLSGNCHQVLTGAGIVCGKGERSLVVVSNVTFSTVTRNMAERYWESREPLGKSGAYAIQGMGAAFVSHIEGSYSNVVGLPLFEINGLLDFAGISIL